MNDIIMLGIGHMEVTPEQILLPEENYPVYLCEPLIAVYLSCLFAEYTETTTKEMMKTAFARESTTRRRDSYLKRKLYFW